MKNRGIERVRQRRPGFARASNAAGEPEREESRREKSAFVVLIGANMPPSFRKFIYQQSSDEKLLRKGDQRQRVADGLYRGIAGISR